MSAAIILSPHSDNRDRWREAWDRAAEILQFGHLAQIVVERFRCTRTAEQNARMWAMLGDLSRQVPWVVNDRPAMLSPEDWKDLMTAALRSELRVARGIDGGVVLLGLRTSRMTIKTMTALIDLMFEFGGRRGVVWTDPKAQAVAA